MKALKSGLICLIALVTMNALKAQTADDVINKYVNAIGGKDKLNGTKTIHLESTLEVMGNEAPMVVNIINGKAYKSETDFNGQKIVQAITDKGGWTINPMMGQTSAQEIPADQLKVSREQYMIGGFLVDYAAKGNKVELQGQEDVDSTKKAYKIKLTTSDSVVVTYYIDPATYYLAKEVFTINANGQSFETAVSFSNYQKTDAGIMQSMTQQLTLPQGITLNINYKKIESNKDIDPKIYDMPKS